MDTPSFAATHLSQTSRSAEFGVRTVGWRDLRAVAAIQKQSFRPGLAYGLAALTTHWLAPGTSFLVATSPEGTVVGTVIGDMNRDNARIMNIAVHPDWRRQGVASVLITALELALPQGHVVLMAEEWNTGAQSLYEHAGFARDGIARDYYGRGKHGVWMRKRRSPAIDSTIRV